MFCKCSRKKIFFVYEAMQPLRKALFIINRLPNCCFVLNWMSLKIWIDVFFTRAMNKQIQAVFFVYLSVNVHETGICCPRHARSISVKVAWNTVRPQIFIKSVITCNICLVRKTLWQTIEFRIKQKRCMHIWRSPKGITILIKRNCKVFICSYKLSCASEQSVHQGNIFGLCIV